MMPNQSPLMAAANGSKNPAQGFSLVKGNYGHYWVCHGTEKIAIFGPSTTGNHDYSLGLFRQYPGQRIPDEWLIEPEVLHFVTRYGLGLTTYWMNTSMDKIVPTLTSDDSDPSCLKLTLTASKSKEEHGTITIAFKLESNPQRYVVEVEYNLTLNKKDGGEFCNFYPHGAGDFRPGLGKYNRILWQDSQGKSWIHWPSVIVPQPSGIELSPKGSFMYLDEPDGNPVVSYDSSQPLAKTEMCLCWFDNHMIWTDPQQDSPPYHYHAKLKAYWLNAAESKNLIQQAETFPLRSFAAKWDNYLPVHMGGINDFESKVDLVTPAVKSIYFPLSQKPDNSVTWDNQTAHSGKHSILFQLNKSGEINERFWGPELLITPGKQVYISAWVKTEQVRGEGFWLETSFGRWDGGKGKGHLGGPFLSEKITGTQDWKKISIPLPVTPSATEWLENRIQFHFKGFGKVWLDDLEFCER
jgi:hypothetical protein